MGLRRWWESTAATLLVCAFAATAAAQHRPANALNWAFGGTVHTVARAGNVAFVGGRFNAVAARHNVVGGFAVISATTSHRALRTARVHGNVNAVVSDGTGGWFLGGNFTFVGPERRPQIVHILSDGRIDSAWTGRVDGRVMALALVGTTLFVGGEFTQAGSGVGGGMPAARTEPRGLRLGRWRAPPRGRNRRRRRGARLRRLRHDALRRRRVHDLPGRIARPCGGRRYRVRHGVGVESRRRRRGSRPAAFGRRFHGLRRRALRQRRRGRTRQPGADRRDNRRGYALRPGGKRGGARTGARAATSSTPAGGSRPSAAAHAVTPGRSTPRPASSSRGIRTPTTP